MTTPAAALASPEESARAEALARFARIRPYLEDGVPLPRLVQRLFTQIERILQINEVRTITK